MVETLTLLPPPSERDRYAAHFFCVDVLSSPTLAYLVVKPEFS